MGRDLSDLVRRWCGVVWVSSGLVSSAVGGRENPDVGRLEGGKD